MKNNYAFDFAAEISSELPFEEIPLSELIKAMRDRLDRVEASGDREAFGLWDTAEEG